MCRPPSICGWYDEQARPELARRLPLIQQGGPHRGGHPTNQTEDIRRTTQLGHLGLNQVQHLVAHAKVGDISSDDQIPVALGGTHSRLVAGRSKSFGQGDERSNITLRPKRENQDAHCDQSIGNPSARRRHADQASPHTMITVARPFAGARLPNQAGAVHNLRRSRPSERPQPHPGTPQLASNFGGAVAADTWHGSSTAAWSSPRHVRGDRSAFVFQGPHRFRLAPSEGTEI